VSEPIPPITAESPATNGTYPDAELTTAGSHYAELVRARAAIIQAGIAIEQAMGLPLRDRAILSREERRDLTKQ
jgi:hypothetical protein